MTRLLLWFLLVVFVAVTAVWLANHPGSVTLEFQSYAVDTSFAALALMAALLAAFAGFIVWFVGWLRRDLPVFGSNRAIKRQSRGLKLMNQSLVALSAGDHKLAGRLIKEAEALLPPQPMVHLIAAEAALHTGDTEAANKRYSALEATEDGRLLGLRGLLGEARRTGREAEALRLARIAFKENRKSPWVLQTLFALEVAAGNWLEAENALTIVAKEKLIDAEQVARHKGALSYAKASELILKGEKDTARKELKNTLKYRADFVPAIISLARLEVASQNAKKAHKLILDTWAKSPHPGLAKVYKELDPSEAAVDWLKRVETLIQTTMDHPESKLLHVDALMDARRYEAAKPVLESLLKNKPSRNAWQYRLALAHALGENPDPIETALSTAGDNARWICQNCSRHPTGWSPLCPECGAFDTLAWQDTGGSFKRQRRLESEGTIALLTDTSTPEMFR